MTLPIYSALVKQHLEWSTVSSSGPPWTWTYWKESTKLIKGLEHLSYKERLRKLGLLSLEKRSGRSYQRLQIPEGRCGGNGARLLSVVPKARTRVTGNKLEHK